MPGGGKAPAVAGQLGTTFCCAQNILNPFSILITVHQQFGINLDHREQVLEVVGNATGELSHRFHLYGLAQAHFGLLQIGDVDGDKPDPGNFTVAVPPGKLGGLVVAPLPIEHNVELLGDHFTLVQHASILTHKKPGLFRR